MASMKFEPQPCRARINQPSGDLVIENLQAVPRFSSGRHIGESQENAGDQLKYEHSECGAAKNVRPACGLARNRVLHGFPDRLGDLQPRLKPVTHFLYQAHGVLAGEILISLAEEAPGVGNSPTWIARFPASTL